MNTKAKLFTGIGAAAAVGIFAVSLRLAGHGHSEEELVYRESKVAYGSLTVGITEEASVEIGTLEQRFELDISALVDSDTTSASGGQTAAGAMPGGFGGMGNGGTGNGGSGMMSFGSFNVGGPASQSQSLEVAEVKAAVGQEVKEGDMLYILTTESVDEIRETLSEDVSDAKADYEALQIEQEESRTQAQQGYDTYVTNGKYAQLVYENELKTYQDAVEEAAKDVDDKQNTYNENMLELTALQEEYEEAQKFLREAQGAVSENYEGRHENAYYYTVYLNTRDTAQKLADQFEKEIESMNEELEQLALDIQAAVRTMNQCQLDYEKAKLDLGQTQEIDAYYAGKASEWYSIQTASLDNELFSAKKRYDTAEEKLAAFDRSVQDNSILSEYSGVVTEVLLSEGDTLSGGSSLVVLNDQETVTMDVSLGEDDYNAVDRDGTVNIVFTAYPDEIFSGRITEVSDAAYDSSLGAVYYTVTVTVQGDVSGLYEGMTGDVTFVTKEMKQVCYVSNRAVFREGTKSYVKVRDDSGNIAKQEVTTGFSDGVHVEVVAGLSEGDIVLIESKVGET
ncbi:MAG: HlyD family efflux transporter periplasmic adaptor subunit [Lachnospiraceae bacterium]|nr:HlyD family efflux transporter periplasmic adaptor subunit [Lachnospiraceae bacterium]